MRRTMKNSRRNRSRRGQAMAEYSIMFWLICIVFILGFFWNGLGWSNKVSVDTSRHAAGVTPNASIFGQLMQGYQIYQNSYYFGLCAPLP